MKTWLTQKKWRYVLIVLPVVALALTVTTAMAHAGSTRPFRSAGSGTEQSLSAPGCQNVGTHDCTVQTTGTATSTHLGTGPYVSTLTVHWGQAYSNGAGGYCAPADGPSTLTAANGDTLSLWNAGTVCEVGATGLYIPHTFSNATYKITGGTGRFAGASGSGTESGGDDGFGNAYYSASGTISY